MILVEIVPNVWLGDIEGEKFKSNIGAKYIVNCLKDLSFLNNHDTYQGVIKDSLEKYEIIKLYEYLCETTKFINSNMIKDDATLIYCENGNQKSATIIAAFLIKYGNHSKESAIQAIRTKYKSAFYPDINYIYSLEMFEQNHNNPI
jgi:protein-tyrosine phosphatase